MAEDGRGWVPGSWQKPLRCRGFSWRIDRGLDMGQGKGPQSLSTECRMGLEGRRDTTMNQPSWRLANRKRGLKLENEGLPIWLS